MSAVIAKVSERVHATKGKPCFEAGLNRFPPTKWITTPSLIVKPDKLTMGAAYTFRLQATDSSGKGYADVELVVNAPPGSGSFGVSPLVGSAPSGEQVYAPHGEPAGGT